MLPSSVAPSNTLTVLLATAVPVSVSVLSLVMPSPTVPLSVENEEMLGAASAKLLTVTFRAAEAALLVPAASVAVAVRLWVALASVAVVKLQAPVPFAVALPSSVAPSNTLTVALASAVPVSVRTLALVMPSPVTPVSGENEAIVGTVGTWVSTVTLSAADAVPVLPAASVAVDVRLWAPSASAAAVKLQAPVPLAGALPSSVTPSNTLTVVLASAVPVSVRVLSLVRPSPTVPLSVENEAMLGATGAMVSMVTLRAAEAALLLPAASVAVAVRLWAPLASAAVV